MADPMKAEKYQDGMLLAREKMQRVQDEKAKEYQEKKMEVLYWCDPLTLSHTHTDTHTHRRTHTRTL